MTFNCIDVKNKFTFPTFFTHILYKACHSNRGV